MQVLFFGVSEWPKLLGWLTRIGSSQGKPEKPSLRMFGWAYETLGAAGVAKRT